MKKEPPKIATHYLENSFVHYPTDKIIPKSIPPILPPMVLTTARSSFMLSLKLWPPRGLTQQWQE